MRIAHVASTVPTSALDARPGFVLELAREISALDHEVHILAPHAPGAALEQSLDGVLVKRFRYWWPSRQRLFGVGGVMAGIRSRPWNLAQIPTAMIAQFVQLLRAGRFDVIHAHWIIPSGLTAVLAGGRTGTPVVVSAHGGDVDAMHFANPAKRWALLRAAAVTANSRAVEAAVRRILPDVDVARIPIGVSLPTPPPARVREILARYGAPLVVFVGRLTPDKGPDVLRAAMEYLPGWKAVFVGEGPMRQELAGMTIVGWQPKVEVAAYLAAADVVAIPSRREGQGLVAFEAQSLRTPVVASEAGGLPEVVDRVVPVGAPKALAAGILAARHSTVERTVPTMRDTAREMTLIYERVVRREKVIAGRSSRQS